MEDIHSAHHCGLVHEWKVVDGPRNTTDLGIYLDQDLVYDRPQILALSDGIAQHYLRWNGELGQEESLDVIVQRVPPLLPRHEQDHCLHLVIHLGFEFLSPSAGIHATLDLEDFRSCTLITELLQYLVQC